MLRNYFKLAWRHLENQKMYALIKIGGFAIGIAACFLIALFIRDELSYDQNIPNQKQVFRVLNSGNIDGKQKQWVYMAAPFAKAIQQDYPEIEKSARFLNSELFGAGSNQIRRADKFENVYEEKFAFADQELIGLLGLKMIQGDPKHALDDPNTLVITKSKADKFFPGENPIGKTVIMNNDLARPREVTGVIEDLPRNSHLSVNFLMTLVGVNFYEGEQTNWLATNYFTYIQVRKGRTSPNLSPGLPR